MASDSSSAMVTLTDFRLVEALRGSALRVMVAAPSIVAFPSLESLKVKVAVGVNLGSAFMVVSAMSGGLVDAAGDLAALHRSEPGTMRRVWLDTSFEPILCAKDPEAR